MMFSDVIASRNNNMSEMGLPPNSSGHSPSNPRQSIYSAASAAFQAVGALFTRSEDSDVNPVTSSTYRPTERNPVFGPRFYFYVGDRIQEVVRNTPDVYETNLAPQIQEKIKIEYPGARVLEEKNIGPWRFYLVKYEGILTVFGPGTTKWPSMQGVHNIYDITRVNVYDPNISDLAVRGEFQRITGDTDNKLTKAEMIEVLKESFLTAPKLNETVVEWENKHGKIDAAFGFSKGAYNTSKIDRPGIVHIMHCSPDNIAGQHNFRQGNDEVSFFTAGRDKCLTIGNKGHVIDGFYKHFNKHDTFEDVYAGKYGKYAQPDRERVPQKTSPAPKSYLPPMGITHNNPHLEPRFLKADLRGSEPKWQTTVDKQTGCEWKHTAIELSSEEVGALDHDLRTMLETTGNEENPIQEPDECAAADALRRQQDRLESSKREIPGFREGMKITGIRIGMTAFGTGVIISLNSGAETFMVAANGAYIAGVQVPMTGGFASALGTGLVYAAPVIAAIVAVNLYKQHQDRKIQHHLKRDMKKTEQEMAANRERLSNFQSFVDNYKDTGLDQKAFLHDVNKVIGEIEASADKMGRRGVYAVKHRNMSGKAGYQYFLQNFQLRQMAADMKAFAGQVMAQKEARDLAESVKNQPLSQLVERFEGLNNHRILSLPDALKSEVLIQEILNQASAGNKEALQYVQTLDEKPMAAVLNPKDVTLPVPLGTNNLKGKKVKDLVTVLAFDNWANEVEKYYHDFQQAVNGGDNAAMNAAGARVIEQLDKNKSSLEKTKIKSIANCETAFDYYKPYIDEVKGNIEGTLAKAQAALANKPSEHTPAFLSSEEVQGVKRSLAQLQLHENLDDLRDIHRSSVEKEGIFQASVALAKELKSLGCEDPAVDSILGIEQNFESFGKYMNLQERIKAVKEGCDNYAQILGELAQEGLSDEDRERLLNESIDKAQKLIEMDICEKDLLYIAENPEKAAEFIKNVKDHPQAVQQFRDSKARDESIRSDFKALTERVNEFNKKDHSAAESQKMHREIAEIANRLLKEKKVTPQDLLQIVGTPENAAQAFEWISAALKGSNDYLNLRFYEDTVYSYALGPLYRLASVMINDFHRYEGYKEAKIFAHGFSAVNALFPDYIPRKVLLQIAKNAGQNDAVIKELSKKCSEISNKNAVYQTLNLVKDPKSITGEQVQSVNTILHLCGRVLPWFSERYLSKSANETVKKVMAVVTPILEGVDLVLKGAHVYGALNQIRQKNLNENEQAQIVANAIEGTIGTLELAESLGKHPDKSEVRNFFVDKLQGLIDFRGKLPERMEYYIGKDILKGVAYGVASIAMRSPSLGGSSVFNLALAGFHGYNSKYLDDVVSAIMSNIRYIDSMPKSKEGDAARDESIRSLKYYLGSKLEPKYVKSNDSIIVQNAITWYGSTYKS